MPGLAPEEDSRQDGWVGRWIDRGMDGWADERRKDGKERRGKGGRKESQFFCKMNTIRTTPLSLVSYCYIQRDQNTAWL